MDFAEVCTLGSTYTTRYLRRSSITQRDSAPRVQLYCFYTKVCSAFAIVGKRPSKRSKLASEPTEQGASEVWDVGISAAHRGRESQSPDTVQNGESLQLGL